MLSFSSQEELCMYQSGGFLVQNSLSEVRGFFGRALLAPSLGQPSDAFPQE